jgi:hypothetical protein
MAEEKTEDFSLIDAMQHLLSGEKVSRRKWESPNKFLIYIKEKEWDIRNARLLRIIDRGGDGHATGEFDMPNPNLLGFIGIRYANGSFAPWMQDKESMHAKDFYTVK